MQKVLLAETDEAYGRISKLISNYEVLSVNSVLKAPAIMSAHRIDLFLIAVHFDHSRAIDLVQLIREFSGYEQTPIIIYRSSPSNLAELLRDTILKLTKCYSVSSYLDLEGSSLAQSDLRSAIESCLPNLKNSN
jgi:CheY-like chemotaxis protein